MRYYIADNHFFHRRINDQMDKRGFSSLDDMHKYMIDQWNSRVNRRDEVVILGDISIGKADETLEILRQLKGRKFLIRGNHDKFLKDKNFDASIFEWVKDYAEMNDNGRKVVTCHYPIMCYNGQFRKTDNGDAKTFMIHGHVHATQDCVGIEHYKEFIRNFPRVSRGSDIPIPAPIQMINCFCMFSDYIPLTLDEWIAKENLGELKNKIQHDWKYGE